MLVVFGRCRFGFLDGEPVSSKRPVLAGWTSNPLTAGVAYIRVFMFYQHIKYHLLNMLKIKCDINQQYLETDFVKSE